MKEYLAMVVIFYSQKLSHLLPKKYHFYQFFFVQIYSSSSKFIVPHRVVQICHSSQGCPNLSFLTGLSKFIIPHRVVQICHSSQGCPNLSFLTGLSKFFVPYIWLKLCFILRGMSANTNTRRICKDCVA